MSCHMSKKTAAIVGLLFLAGISSVADATHKSWVRYEGGTSCVREGWNSTSSPLRYEEAVWNPSTTLIQRVLCPVALGGRFPANGIAVHSKVPAMRAEVHYDDPSALDSLSCQMVAVTGTGSVHYSESRYSCLQEGGCTVFEMDDAYRGTNVLTFADPRNIANRRIGLVGADAAPGVVSLTFDCFLPRADPNEGSSGITGILTQICQRDPATSGFVCSD
jgi:hypothetical protein